MRISNATLRSYGIFRNRRVEFDETQSIFLAHGRNEGGKSTLLSFMRNMLFGYAKTSGEYSPFSKEGRYAEGTVEFQTQDALRGAIERRWEQGGEPELEFRARLGGASLTREELTAFLGGGMVNRDFFANFFGISYREIATGESRLTSKKLSETVYGLAFGNAEQFTKARDNLKKRMESLYLPKGKKKPQIQSAIQAFQDAKARRGSNSTDVVARLEEETRNLEEDANRATHALIEARRAASFADSQVGALEAKGRYDAAEARLGQLLSRGYESAALAAFDEEAERNSASILEELGQAQRDAQTLKGRVADAELGVASAKAALNPVFAERYDAIDAQVAVASSFKDGRNGLEESSRALFERRRRLFAELEELGALAPDASESERGEAFAARLRALPAPLAQELDAYARRERSLEDAARDEKPRVDAKRREFERATAALDAAKKELDALGEDAQKDVGEIVEETELLAKERGRVESARKTLTDYRRKRAKIEETTRRLADAALGEDAQESHARLRLDALLLKNPDAALPIATDVLLKNYAQAQGIVQERRKEFESAERDVAALERELEALGATTEDVETLLAEARARRDAQWNVVAEYLEQGNVLALEEEIFFNALRAFKRGVDETDALQEKRRDSAEKKGYVEKLRRDLSAKTQERDAIRELLDESVEHAAKIERETKFFFAQGGFDFCAAWSMDALLAWLGEWRALAGLLDELSEIENDVEAFALELHSFLSRCAQIAADWGADLGYDATTPLSLDAPVETLETLLTRFDAAARRWKLLEGDAKRRQERIVEYARCVDERRRVEGELRDVEAATTARDAERVALAADLSVFLKKIDPPFGDEARRSWNALLLFFQGLKHWREDALRLEKDCADFDAKRSRFEAHERAVRALAETLGSSDLPAGEYLTILNRWKEIATRARDAENTHRERAKAQEQDARLLKEVDAKIAAIRNAHKTIWSRFVEKEEEFGEFRQLAREYREARQERKTARWELAKTLNLDANSPEFETAVDQLSERDPEELRAALQEATERLAAREEEAVHARELHYAKKKELEGALAETGGADAEYAYTASLASLSAGIEEYIPLKLAYEALNASLKEFEETRVPRILERASRLFRDVTDGAYERIFPSDASEGKGRKGRGSASATVDESRFNDGAAMGYLVETRGETKTLDALSQGTREQLYLAIRLALIEEYAVDREPLPLLADDVLVQYDDRRVEKTIEALSRFASPRQQVILMTHHGATRDAFARIVGSAGIIELDE